MTSLELLLTYARECRAIVFDGGTSLADVAYAEFEARILAMGLTREDAEDLACEFCQDAVTHAMPA